MPLYRVVSRISSDKGRREIGEIFTQKDMKPNAIRVLLSRKAIAEVSGPPLDVLPGWGKRARALASLGITGSVEFLDEDAAELATKLGVESEVIRQCQQEVLGWLTIDK